MRREGVPIASDQTGYYYAQTAGEVYGTIRTLKKMRSGLDAAITGLERSLNGFLGIGVRTIAAPFIPWVGGKEKLVPYISQVLPPNAHQLLDPFGGGGA